MQTRLIAFLNCRSVEQADGPSGSWDIRGVGNEICVIGPIPQLTELWFFARYLAPSRHECEVKIVTQVSGATIARERATRVSEDGSFEFTTVLTVPVLVSQPIQARARLLIDGREIGAEDFSIRITGFGTSS